MQGGETLGLFKTGVGFMSEGIKAWLLEEKIRLFILVGPLFFLICSLTAFLSSPDSAIGSDFHFLPVISLLSHICSWRAFTRIPGLLLGIWLMTAIFSLIALIVVGVAGLK